VPSKFESDTTVAQGKQQYGVEERRLYELTKWGGNETTLLAEQS